MGRHSARFTVTDRSKHRREFSQGKRCGVILSAWVVAFVSMGAAAVVVPDQEPILRLPRLAAPAPVLKTPHHWPGPVIAEVVGPSTVRPTLRLTELRVAAVAAVRPLVTPEATEMATPEPARRGTPRTAAAEPKRDTSKTAAEPAKPVQPKPRPWPRPKPHPDPEPGGEQGEQGSGEPTSGGEESNGGGNSGGEHAERKHPLRDLVKHVISKAKDSKSKRSSKGDSDE